MLALTFVLDLYIILLSIMRKYNFNAYQEVIIMKSIKRILATALMLAMVFTLLGSTFTVSAASTVNCTDSIIVVDDDFANAAKGTAVSAIVAGTTYKGVMGSTAFATIEEAYEALKAGGSIYVAAGIYSEQLKLNKTVSLFGNKTDVNPNNENEISEASDKRSATGKDETILQDTLISYLPRAMDEQITGSCELTVNGFALTGDSCIRLQEDRASNARVTITCNVFDLVNDKAYDKLGITDAAFSAVQIGQPASYSFVAALATITNNRIERVGSAGNGIATTAGFTASWVTEINISGNYIANVTGDGFNVAHLVNTTTVSNNYVKNAGMARVHEFIRGTVKITGNTFDTVGGSTGNGQYALGVYAEANTSTYSSNWPVDTENVQISGNTFTNLGKAIRLYGRLRQSDSPINSSPYGTKIFDNVFVPAAAADCTFIHMSYGDGLYKVPVYDNYTGGRNPKDVCLIDASDSATAFAFDEYWLNEEKTDPSSLLDVTAITNTNGVSFAGADIKVAPDCSITTSIPSKLNEVQIGLEVKEGAYYELFSDATCTTPLENNTVALTPGQISYAYAKVYYGNYSAVYNILLTSKVAYTDYLDASEYVVGPEFSQYPANQQIYVEVNGEWRRAITGHSAFSDLPLAMDKAMSGDIIYMTAGAYETPFTIQGKGVKIRGAKAGINPNNMNSADYSRSDERGDLNEETRFTANITLMSGINGISFDGVTFTEKGRFLFSGSFGIENMTFENIMCTGSTDQDALLYRGRNDTGKNTFSNFRLANSRFEGAGTNYVMRLPNISNGIFEANVFTGCNKNIYMGGHDGSSTDVLMFKDNIFQNITVSNFLYIGQSTNGTNDIGARVKNSIAFDGNKVLGCTGGTFMYLDRWTAGNHLTITNNRFEGSKGQFSVNCYEKFTGQTIDIHENYFDSSITKILTNNLLATVADCSYNYFANGPVGAIAGAGTYVPYYTDAAMTKLAGAYEITSVTSPAAAVLDGENKTITYNAATAANFLDFAVEVSDGCTYKIYSDITCQNEISSTITLKGVETVFYVKVFAEDGVSSAVYTVTVNQPINNNAELLGIDVEGSTWVEQGTKYNCVLPNSYVKGPLLPIVSAGGSASFYATTDTELTTPINYTVDMDIPVGKTSYLIKVTSEDGTNEQVYEVSFTRTKSTAAELVDVKDSIEDVTIDGNVAMMTVDNETTSLLPELVVSDGATYELFSDIGCNIYQDEALALVVGENKVYAKVTAEDGVTSQVYTIVIERMDKSADKRIMVASFPIFATSEDELVNDATGEMIGMKRIDNSAKVLYLQPNDYIASLKDTLVVNDGATYEIFAQYDEGTEELSGKLSSNSDQKTIKLAEGTNTFYIRINALNGSSAVFKMIVLNKIRNTESDIISVNGFAQKRVDNVITGSNGTDNPQVDIFVSDNATAKVYADRKKTKEIPSTMTSYTVTETKETFTNCKLSSPMSQGYMVLYVDVTSQTGVTSSYVLKLTAGMFSAKFKDIEDHWAAKYINEAYLMGVTNGTKWSDGTYTFNPQDKATREQVAVFMCNLMGVNSAAYQGVTLKYKDAKQISKWASNAVKAVYELGIMQGDGTNFNPKANISRQEFMSVMVRAAALDTSKGSASNLKRFKDGGDVAKWAKTAVATAVAYGLVNGDEHGYLNPTKSISRAEIVTIMVGAKNYVR